MLKGGFCVRIPDDRSFNDLFVFGLIDKDFIEIPGKPLPSSGTKYALVL